MLIDDIVEKYNRKWFRKEYQAFLAAKRAYSADLDNSEKRLDYYEAFQILDTSLKQLLSARVISQDLFSRARQEIMENKSV